MYWEISRVVGCIVKSAAGTSEYSQQVIFPVHSI